MASGSPGSIFKMKKSREWNEFQTWCDINNIIPSILIKNYMKYTVLTNTNLLDFMNKFIQVSNPNIKE